jgi:hypothetical protein
LAAAGLHVFALSGVHWLAAAVGVQLVAAAPPLHALLVVQEFPAPGVEPEHVFAPVPVQLFALEQVLPDPVGLPAPPLQAFPFAPVPQVFPLAVQVFTFAQASNSGSSRVLSCPNSPMPMDPTAASAFGVRATMPAPAMTCSAIAMKRRRPKSVVSFGNSTLADSADGDVVAPLSPF